MNRVEVLVDFFTGNPKPAYNLKIPTEIIDGINHLDKAQRSELKSRLFHAAKILASDNGAHTSVFWLENCFQLIDKYTYRYHKVYFSPGHDIPDTILELINHAEASLSLCVFTISHHKLARAIGRALKRGVKVKLLTDDRKVFDKGSQIIPLHNKGVEIKTDTSRYHMHNKFGIVDERLVFTGSFNWTYTATKHNQENLLVTTNYDIVNQYVDEFKTLWAEMSPLNFKQ